LQKQGLNNAQENPISFIQGPPGTGKTFTGATIALYFSILEKGGVLLTAPSNFAADGAAEKNCRDCCQQFCFNKHFANLFALKTKLS